MAEVHVYTGDTSYGNNKTKISQSTRLAITSTLTVAAIVSGILLATLFGIRHSRRSSRRDRKKDDKTDDIEYEDAQNEIREISTRCSTATGASSATGLDPNDSSSVRTHYRRNDGSISTEETKLTLNSRQFDVAPKKKDPRISLSPGGIPFAMGGQKHSSEYQITLVSATNAFQMLKKPNHDQGPHLIVKIGDNPEYYNGHPFLHYLQSQHLATPIIYRPGIISINAKGQTVESIGLTGEGTVDCITFSNGTTDIDVIYHNVHDGNPAFPACLYMYPSIPKDDKQKEATQEEQFNFLNKVFAEISSILGVSLVNPVLRLGCFSDVEQEAWTRLFGVDREHGGRTNSTDPESEAYQKEIGAKMLLNVDLKHRKKDAPPLELRGPFKRSPHDAKNIVGEGERNRAVQGVSDDGDQFYKGRSSQPAIDAPDEFPGRQGPTIVEID